MGQGQSAKNSSSSVVVRVPRARAGVQLGQVGADGGGEKQQRLVDAAEIPVALRKLDAERAQLFPVAVPQPAVADDDRHAGGGKQLDDRHIAHSRADEADARGGVGLNVFLQHKTLSMRT